MQPEDPFEVEAFAAALETGGRIDKAEARLHADNAYVFVEFLANTYPKMPADATERDAWVFLFDYAITQGPFAGPATRLTPRSLGLFMEFVARRRRVHEIEPIQRQSQRRPMLSDGVFDELVELGTVLIVEFTCRPEHRRGRLFQGDL